MTFDDHAGSRHDALVRLVYRCAVEPQLWPDALQSLARLFGDAGALLGVQFEDGRREFFCSPSLDRVRDEYLARWAAEDIRFEWGVRQAALLGIDAFSDQHVLPLEALDDQPFYRDFLIPRGLKWFMATPAGPGPDTPAFLAILRRTERGPFQGADLDGLSRWGRHVACSLSIGNRVRSLNAQTGSLLELFDSCSIGVYRVHDDGTAAPANETARGLLKRQLFYAVNGALLGRSKKTTEILRTCLSALAGGPFDGVRGPLGPFVVSVEKEGAVSYHSIHAVPVALGASTAPCPPGRPEPVGFIMVTTNGPSTFFDPVQIRQSFNLTVAESSVAALLAGGRNTFEIAEELQISRETVRTHLKRIYSKTGVRTQRHLADAIRALTF